MSSLDERSGGPIRAVVDLSLCIKDKGFECEIVGFGPSNIRPSIPGEITIHSLPLCFPKRYYYSPGLGSWIDLNLDRFDGVVIHGMWHYANRLFARACRRKGIPYVCFPHGMLDPWAIFGQGYFKATKKVLYWALVERAVFVGAGAVFFTTRRELHLATTVLRLRKAAALVSPYYWIPSVASHIEGPDNGAILQPEGRRVALFLGRLHPKKNVDLLIRAWCQAAPPTEWHLIIAGTGSPAYADRLRALATRLKLDDRVHFVGHVSGSDKEYLLRRADWFLLPSKQENFGIAVLEAMSKGCAVAVSDQVFVSEHFHSEAEVLPLQIADWCSFLRIRMPDDRWRQHLRERDVLTVLPKFTMETVTAAWADALRASFSGEAHIE
jgi:glycosyltransferase involved in cell wall biosynthesis